MVLERHLYTSGQPARTAGVTVRTLRYYDKLRLVSPTARTEAGYRLYSEKDAQRLLRVLCLKQLGFSLESGRGSGRLAGNAGKPIAIACVKTRRA